MLVLFTDFGLAGPYTGQMKAVLHREAPNVPVVELLADAPRDPKPAAYLLAAYAAWFPAGTVILGVVDPGVGGARPAVMLEADGRWYVGPGNGLFELVRRRAAKTRLLEITWRPPRLSASFHGRDLFAPVAARLARGEPARGAKRAADFAAPPDWPDDLAEIVYVDGYGNALTGCRAAGVTGLSIAGRALPRARTFADAPPGTAFWYENSNGLAEIAVNGGRADTTLGLGVGTPIALVDQSGRNPTSSR
jgi:S-adenosylmethionine hydrolase